MKKFVFLVIIILISIGIFYFFSLNDYESPIAPLSPTTAPAPENSVLVDFNSQSYRIYYTKLSGKKISLIPNFDTQQDALTVAQENNCASATSGGFYTENNKPLGFFKVDGTVISAAVSDTKLLTGYFYLDEQGDPKITYQIPANYSTAFQTGPYIIYDKPFSTVNDKQARRIVIVETDQQDYYSTAIILEGDELYGPTLRDLPPILFSIETPFTVSRALNLDGGKASFYFNGETTLSELTPVGSVMCIR